MEVQDIRFTGLGGAVSDVAVPDGELSISHNIFNDHGSMRPVWVPEDMMQLEEGEKLVHVHRTSAYKNYIVSKQVKATNHVSVFHKTVEASELTGDNYIAFVVVMEYPPTSEVKVKVKVLVAETTELEETIVFPVGESGKKYLTLGEYTGADERYLGASIETEDGYYDYALVAYEDSDNASEAAVWYDEVPGSVFGFQFFTDEDAERKKVLDYFAKNGNVKMANIGNTLVVTGEAGLEYALYKDGGYKPLGQKPPELNVQWYLDMYERSYYYDDEPITADGNIYEELFDEPVQTDVATQISAKVNKALAESEADNWFTSTFFVRCAYRMYNGAYMVSPPVMMPLNAGAAPALLASGDNLGQGNLTQIKLGVKYFEAKLGMRIPYFDYRVKPGLEDWSDIIDGVDIYVTKGISKYDQDGKPEKIVKQDDVSCISYGWKYVYGGEPFYARNDIRYGSNEYHLVGMQKTDEDYLNELKSASVFYKLKSYKVDELKPEMKVELAENALKNLTTSTLLSDESDEYQEHDRLYAEGMMMYNRRLNLYGVKNEKYNFPLYALSAYTDGYLTEEKDKVEKLYSYSVRFVIGSEGQSVNVTSVEDGVKMYEPPLYLFYPDNAAKRAIIERTDEGNGRVERAEVVLSSHPYLQGSYWMGGLVPLRFGAVTDGTRLEVEKPEERMIANKQKIYTSEVDNPFVFPLGGINSVGTGEVMGISTATQALSQGQFGQFPLYVFSTEGVWAMEVGSNGLYASVKPVSRDVCLDGESIVQTDHAVVFVAAKGVMMVSGSETVCLSESMNGRVFDPASVSHLDKLLTGGGIPRRAVVKPVFMDYANGARMAYDYANNRIFMYRSDMEYCYVYSLGSGTWATADIRIESVVTDYPDIYLQWGNQIKVPSKYMDYNDVREVKTLLLTRPLKLGSDGFKTVREVVVRGAMDRKKGAVLLWGSHDGEYYTLIGDACGTRLYRLGGSGYRYFRVGVVGTMKVGELLDMVSVGFERRYDNRLR